jgi:hypothetical protein
LGTAQTNTSSKSPGKLANKPPHTRTDTLLNAPVPACCLLLTCLLRCAARTHGQSWDPEQASAQAVSPTPLTADKKTAQSYLATLQTPQQNTCVY